MKVTEQIQNPPKSGEREILKIKITQNIAFPEARRLVEMLFIKPTFCKNHKKLLQMKTK